MYGSGNFSKVECPDTEIFSCLDPFFSMDPYPTLTQYKTFAIVPIIYGTIWYIGIINIFVLSVFLGAFKAGLGSVKKLDGSSVNYFGSNQLSGSIFMLFLDKNSVPSRIRKSKGIIRDS